MAHSKSHNRIYLLTTISIYVGLVLVGGAPEVLAGSKLAESIQNPAFEFTTRSETISSKLKLRKRVESDQIIPHAFPGSAVFELPGRSNGLVFVEQSIIAREIKFSNDQIFTTNQMPRPGL
ncbi:MAG: hypothetical protein HKN33_01530 [Pyrinomonadaceae bacterium]|nr:hypothetical protein [Pyrinomonadaceae bacterium]